MMGILCPSKNVHLMFALRFAPLYSIVYKPDILKDVKERKKNHFNYFICMFFSLRTFPSVSFITHSNKQFVFGNKPICAKQNVWSATNIIYHQNGSTDILGIRHFYLDTIEIFFKKLFLF